MDEIEHRYVEVKGLKLHVAEIGSGQSVVVFLHGFPEIWYSWRHQMIAVSNAGYRAIAPDFRGYGLSDPPPEPENAALGDLLSLTSSLFLMPSVFLRSFGEEFKLPNTKVECPALLIMGEKDYVFKFPGIEDYIRSGQVKTFVPDLGITYLPEGTHFVQEQLPDQVNQLILTFLSQHS